MTKLDSRSHTLAATSAHDPSLPAALGGRQRFAGLRTGFWVCTALFALQMGFTAYAQLTLAQVAATFAHLGFPGYFRVALAWAKLAGLLALLVPAVPAVLKEWAYAGFAFTLASALVAHLAVGDGASAWSWSVGTGVLWAGSYYFFHRLRALGR